MDQVAEDSCAQETVAEIIRREKESTAAVKQRVRLTCDLAKEKLKHQRRVANEQEVLVVVVEILLFWGIYFK